MRPWTTTIVLWCFVAGMSACIAQQRDKNPAASAQETPLRIGVSGGLGVSYMRMPDVVDLANIASASLGAYQKLSGFKTAAEFFGAVTIPCSPDWVLKLEYTYMLASYNVPTAYGTGQAEFNATIHLPSLIIQYVLMNEPVYNVKIGAGGGYHVGALDVSYFTQNDRYSGSGPGFVLDAEGNTAFGESLYAYLGVNVRWDFIGKLTNNAGLPPYNAGDSGSATTMHFFGLGARLGLTYYF